VTCNKSGDVIISQSYACMQHSPSVLPTPSPSSKKSNHPEASLLHPPLVPPSSSAMMDKIKY